MIVALSALVSCSTNDPICSEVTGGEVAAELVAEGWWENESARLSVALTSESELQSFWEQYPHSLSTTDPLTGAMDAAATAPPVWTDGTQIVALGFNNFYDDGQSEIIKFATADDQLTVELIFLPYCPEGGPEYGFLNFFLYRTPALGAPVVCETSTHCINY